MVRVKVYLLLWLGSSSTPNLLTITISLTLNPNPQLDNGPFGTLAFLIGGRGFSTTILIVRRISNNKIWLY